MNKKSDRFYRAVYRVAQPLARLYIRNKFRYTNAPIESDEPFILMSNHLTELDFYILMAAVKNKITFVCSEHLYRGNFVQRTMPKLFDPICLPKGTVSTGTVVEILRRSRAGENIMIFPEGNRSYNGVTEKIGINTGKLVKKAGVKLITFRMSGGYFAAPRWSPTARKGDMWGGVVGVYPKEQIASMTPEEITDLINEDIYEDAYARQLKNPRKYTGEKLGEGIENYLFICPNCGKISSIQSKDDKFWCDCGLKGKYDEYAMLRGENLRFNNIRDWGAWIEEEFDRRYDTEWGDGILFSDGTVELRELTPDHQTVPILSGEMTGDKTGFTVGTERFEFKKIQGFEYINLGNTLLLQSKGKYWEIYRKGLCGPKYRMLWQKANGTR